MNCGGSRELRLLFLPFASSKLVRGARLVLPFRSHPDYSMQFKPSTQANKHAKTKQKLRCRCKAGASKVVVAAKLAPRVHLLFGNCVYALRRAVARTCRHTHGFARSPPPWPPSPYAPSLSPGHTAHAQHQDVCSRPRGSCARKGRRPTWARSPRPRSLSGRSAEGTCVTVYVHMGNERL